MANRELLIQDYGTFWKMYLSEHVLPATRMLHYLGTSLVIFVTTFALFKQYWALLILTPIIGYGPAWISHAYVEHNKPVSFLYPWWSLFSDYRMFFLFLTGRLQPHLDRAGVKSATIRPKAKQAQIPDGKSSDTNLLNKRFRYLYCQKLGLKVRRDIGHTNLGVLFPTKRKSS